MQKLWHKNLRNIYSNTTGQEHLGAVIWVERSLMREARRRDLQLVGLHSNASTQNCSISLYCGQKSSISVLLLICVMFFKCYFLTRALNNSEWREAYSVHIFTFELTDNNPTFCLAEPTSSIYIFPTHVIEIFIRMS